jgi:hypothetical protein
MRHHPKIAAVFVATVVNDAIAEAANAVDEVPI